ncbi:hypothetical protein [Mycolicibacterium aichiense]|uniref:hypothetical protein n=1 Tax=Mycolicibacterium aichiense TaxID=1799 RepID=UPI0011C03AA3|nr:hypothetical protein [Mycolicibacterium aichiense]MCV7021587.1 hypothetical protein [Mycolicibacterium aichiense]
MLFGLAAREVTREFLLVALASRSATEELPAAITRFERDATGDGRSAPSATVRFAFRGVVDRAPASARWDEPEAGPAEDDPAPLSALAVPTSDPTRDQPTNAAPMPADATPS